MIKFLGRRLDKEGKDIIKLVEDGVEFWVYPIGLFEQSIYESLKEQGYTVASYNPWDMKDATGVPLSSSIPVDDSLTFEDDDIDMAKQMAMEALPEYDIRKDYVATSTTVINFAEGDYKINTKEEFIEALMSLRDTEFPVSVPINYMVAPEARLSFEDLLESEELLSKWCNIFYKLNFADYNALEQLKVFLKNNAGFEPGDKLDGIEFLKAYLHWGFSGIKDTCIKMDEIRGNWGNLLARPYSSEPMFNYGIGLVKDKSVLVSGAYEVDLLEVGAELDDEDILIDENANKIGDILTERRTNNNKYTKAWIKKKETYDMLRLMFVTENGYKFDIYLTTDRMIIRQHGNSVSLFETSLFSVDSIDKSYTFTLKNVWTREQYAIEQFVHSQADRVIKACTKETPVNSTLDMLLDVGYTYRQAIDYLAHSCKSDSGSALYSPFNHLEDVVCQRAIDTYSRNKFDTQILSFAGYLEPEDYENWSSKIKDYYDKEFGTVKLATYRELPHSYIDEMPDDYYDNVDPSVDSYLEYMYNMFDADPNLEKNMTKSCLLSIDSFENFNKTLSNLRAICNGAKIGKWNEGIIEDLSKGAKVLYEIYKALIYAEVAEPTLDDAIRLIGDWKSVENYIDLTNEYSIKEAGYNGYLLDRANASYNLYHNARFNIFVSKVFRELCNDPEKQARHQVVMGLAVASNKSDTVFRENWANEIINCINLAGVRPEHKELAYLYADELACKCVDLALRKPGDITQLGHIPLNIGEDTYQIPISSDSWEVFKSVPRCEHNLITLNYLYSFSGNGGIIWFNPINCKITPFRVTPILYPIPEYALGAQLFNIEDINNKQIYHCDESEHLHFRINSGQGDGIWLQNKQKWGYGQEHTLKRNIDGVYEPATYDMLGVLEAECISDDGMAKIDNIFNYYTRFALHGKKCTADNNGIMISRVATTADFYYIKMADFFNEELLSEDEFYEPKETVKWFNFLTNNKVYKLTPESSRNNQAMIGVRSSVENLKLSNFDLTIPNYVEYNKELLRDNLGTAYVDKFSHVLLIYNSAMDVFNRNISGSIDLETATNVDVEKLVVDGVMMRIADGAYVYRSLNAVECIKFVIGA